MAPSPILPSPVALLLTGTALFGLGDDGADFGRVGVLSSPGEVVALLRSFVWEGYGGGTLLLVPDRTPPIVGSFFFNHGCFVGNTRTSGRLNVGGSAGSMVGAGRGEREVCRVLANDRSSRKRCSSPLITSSIAETASSFCSLGSFATCGLLLFSSYLTTSLTAKFWSPGVLSMFLLWDEAVGKC